MVSVHAPGCLWYVGVFVYYATITAHNGEQQTAQHAHTPQSRLVVFGEVDRSVELPVHGRPQRQKQGNDRQNGH